MHLGKDPYLLHDTLSARLRIFHQIFVNGLYFLTNHETVSTTKACHFYTGSAQKKNNTKINGKGRPGLSGLSIGYSMAGQGLLLGPFKKVITRVYQGLAVPPPPFMPPPRATVW